MILEFLARYARRSGNAEARDRVLVTLERMALGGIHDHLGGGFARYSVDERWLAPHFEKMLYDNAQLLELYALFAAETGSALFRFAAEGIVAWLDPRDGDAGRGVRLEPRRRFGGRRRASSTSGRWTRSATCSARDADLFAPRLRRHRSTATGRRPTSSTGCVRAGATIRRSKRGSPACAMRSLAVGPARIRPGLDDKVLADWNGLMIAALVRAALALERPEWIGLARRAFAFVAAQMSRGDSLGHSWRAGQLIFPGFALDHAAMMRAALALHEATGEAAYLDRARAWRDGADARLSRYRHRHPRHDGRERRRARRPPAALA